MHVSACVVHLHTDKQYTQRVSSNSFISACCSDLFACSLWFHDSFCKNLTSLVAEENFPEINQLYKLHF